MSREDDLIARLEQMGTDKVAEALSNNLMANWKVPIAQRWLNSINNEVMEAVNLLPDNIVVEHIDEQQIEHIDIEPAILEKPTKGKKK
jgi:hypothetical protein